MNKAILIFALVLVGCGTDLTGSYNGSRKVTNNGGFSFRETLTASLTDNEDLVEGTWSTQNVSGTFRGYKNGGGMNVNMNESQSSYYGGCQYNYTGTLNFNGDVINGTLIGTSQDQRRYHCPKSQMSLSMTKL